MSSTPRTLGRGATTRALYPMPKGQVIFTSSPQVSQSAATLGIGVLNVLPWVVTDTITLDRIGLDITGASEAGGLARPAIYADAGCYPGVPVLDPGTIDATVVQRSLITIALTLAPGLYWIGAAVQNVTTTQPGFRCPNNWTPPVHLGTASGAPGSSAAYMGYSMTGVTGALPTFSATRTVATLVPRVHVRTA